MGHNAGQLPKLTLGNVAGSEMLCFHHYWLDFPGEMEIKCSHGHAVLEGLYHVGIIPQTNHSTESGKYHDFCGTSENIDDAGIADIRECSSGFNSELLI